MPKQRAYGVLRVYFLKGRPSHAVARAYGCSPRAIRVMCRQFRRDPASAIFLTARRGPGTQPRKTAAREFVVALRKRNYSIPEISDELDNAGGIEHADLEEGFVARQCLRRELGWMMRQDVIDQRRRNLSKLWIEVRRRVSHSHRPICCSVTSVLSPVA